MEKGAARNFLTRTLSGIVILVVFLGATLLSPYSFAALSALICIFSLYEFYALAEKKGLQPMKTAGAVAGILPITAATLILATRNPGCAAAGTCMLILLVPLLVFASFIAELFRGRDNPLGNIAATLLGVLYIAVPLTLLLFIPYMPVPGSAACHGEYKPWVAIWYVFIIWMNDIGAYLIGVRFGRHRLFERISPKKSWEGFFGGLAFGTGTGILAGYVMGHSIPFWAGAAAVAVLSGVLGDLIESMFKRSAGVKDSGSIIPGHGGMLDRFDALIFSVPFVFIYFLIFAL